MKRLLAMFFCCIILIACGGGSGGGGDDSVVYPPAQVDPNKPVTPANPVAGDCRIVSAKQIGDFGLVGQFEIKLDFSSLPEGEKFVRGQKEPNDAWISYFVDNSGIVVMEYVNGGVWEFSYGTTIGGVEHWVDTACSIFSFPNDVAPENRHLRLILGENKTCSEKTIDDPLVISIQDLGNNKHRIYIDFAKLPIRDYKDIFVDGQSAPNDIWVHYAVVDNFPCFYTDVAWPSGAEPFEFTFCVVKQDGSKECADPTLSKFLYNDHLAIPL